MATVEFEVMTLRKPLEITQGHIRIRMAGKTSHAMECFFSDKINGNSADGD
jgi:hypothetical protein